MHSGHGHTTCNTRRKDTQMVERRVRKKTDDDMDGASNVKCESEIIDRKLRIAENAPNLHFFKFNCYLFI